MYVCIREGQGSRKTAAAAKRTSTHTHPQPLIQTGLSYTHTYTVHTYIQTYDCRQLCSVFVGERNLPDSDELFKSRRINPATHTGV